MHTLAFSLFHSRLRVAGFLLWLLTGGQQLSAFPPAPGFTLYGTVRDEYGWIVDAPDARIQLRDKASKQVVATSEIRSNALLTENFRVMLPIDQLRTADLYKPGALDLSARFFIEVIVGNSTHWPVITQDTTEPGGFRKLDLTLGRDQDTDGLPDAWESWQLDLAGRSADELSYFDREGDIDGDGASNYAEFLAGTFAYLRTDVLELDRVTDRKIEAWGVFQFFAVISKTYLVERSLDLMHWSPVDFGLGENRTNLVTEFTATHSNWQTIQVSAADSRHWFYRVRVR